MRQGRRSKALRRAVQRTLARITDAPLLNLGTVRVVADGSSAGIGETSLYQRVQRVLGQTFPALVIPPKAQT